MSGHAAGGGQNTGGKVTLTLWVHDASQAPGTQQTIPDKTSYGVPLANALSSEIILSPELLKNESLDLQIGDVVELVKASSANGSNAGSGSHSARNASTAPSLNGTVTREGRYKRLHPHSGRRSSAMNGPKPLPNGDSLVFRVERSSLANEGSSGQLQISISQTLAHAFELKNRDQIILRKLPSPLPKEYIADHVELYFKDQYLGRADMHRISLALADSCVYKEQKVQLSGLNIRARIGGVWVAGKQRKSALFISDTKTVFRSESAKYYIFIQLSKEMWMFDDDGSLFFEKAVDLFLPELFSRWEKKGTNHIVSIVLFSRIIYDKDEIEIVDRPLMVYDPSETEDRWTDVYQIIVDLETSVDWSQALHSLRKEFQTFRQDVLLRSSPRNDGKLAGKISAAHEGGVLEAINMALSSHDKHYVDRDLQRTGLSIVIITAGTSHFNVNKNLLRLTTERMIQEGFGVDCVSLAKMPLHAVPLFKYTGTTSKQSEKDVALDHLYTEDDLDRPKEPLYTIPYWVDSSFYAKHQDKPFRCDRFLPRCRMPSITSIGIAEYENANIALPFLSDELKILEGYGPDWEQLSKREKLNKQWEKFDSIACGALGKWQLLDMKERRDSYNSRQNRRTSSFATHSSSSLDARSHSTTSHTSSGGSGSENGGSGTEEGQAGIVKALQLKSDRGRTIHSKTSAKPPLDLSASHVRGGTPLAEVPESPRTRTRESSVSTVLSRQCPSMNTSHARPRTASTASLSTISRSKSNVAFKSPSVVADSKGLSGGHPERRVASSSASSATAVERAQPALAGSGASAMATLMAAQAKLTPSRQNGEKPSTAGSMTSWLWGRRAKPTLPTVNRENATTTAGKPSDDANLATSNSEANTASKSDKSSPAASLVSRRASVLSMKRPVASLSVTPATPAAATTSGPGAGPMPITAQPIGLGNASAAFNVASNDIMSDPKSLEDHSLQQYFLEATRQNQAGARNLKVKIEHEKGKRMNRLNPSNPSRSSIQLQDQSRRWLNIFPRAGRINNQRSVKWKSMCTPACLPLYSDYLPSFEEVAETYLRDSYTLPVSPSMSSFLLRPGKDISETAGNLLRELVCQRLAQSFQIVVPPYDDLTRTTGRKPPNLWNVPSAEDVRQILYNTSIGEGKAIFLGFSNTVHRLRFDRSSACIAVTTWKEKTTWQAKHVDYTFMLWPVGNDIFHTSKVQFAYPDLAGYDWRYMDRLTAGLEEPKLQEKTKYWRTRFVLIPTDVPDLQGMIQSQSKILLEDSTEDDLRIAGVMTLYEQFSKARWQVQPKERSKTQLVYSTTPYDPSIYAADEAERLTLESSEPAMPDAYSEDLFFEDLSPRELTRMLVNGPRPVRLQPRRSGFRRIEDSFTGQDFVTWLKDEFVDIPDKDTALLIGNDLVQKGIIAPLNPPKRLVDGYTFYQVAAEYKTGPKTIIASSSFKWLGDDPEAAASPSVTQSQSFSHLEQSTEGTPVSVAPAIRYTADGRLIIPMSHSILINLDVHNKSDRRETAFLHFDAAHNTTNGFHFQLEWLCTSRLVEDLLTSWQRNMQKYGLKLVEENIRQVQDISRDNPLQAPQHIQLVIPPPDMPEIDDILSKTVVTKDYFETQLLRELGYVLDVEADSNFPSHIYPEYSYLKSPYDHSQFIHKSGSCYVQVLGSGQGYLFLKNRLYLSHRQQKRPNKTKSDSAGGGGGGNTAPSTASMTASMMLQQQHSGSYLARTQSHYQAQQVQIEELSEPYALKRQLQDLCSSPDELNMRWENMMNAILMVAAGNAGVGSLNSGGLPSSTIAPSEAYSLRSNRGLMRSLETTPADHPLPASLPPSSLSTPALSSTLKGESFVIGPS